ncbi:MAG TPA: hypothetical protein VIC82_11515, partial [Candidatus Nanopelagicales bacterium]
AGGADLPYCSLTLAAGAQRAGRVASAQCRWLLLVAQFDALDGASEYGLPTTTRWISHHCGIAARTHVSRCP